MTTTEYTLAEQAGLTIEAFSSTLLYTLMGVVILLVAIIVMNFTFGLSIRKELIKDQNIAVGIVIAGVAVAIGIIIAGTIGS